MRFGVITVDVERDCVVIRPWPSSSARLARPADDGHRFVGTSPLVTGPLTTLIGFSQLQVYWIERVMKNSVGKITERPMDENRRPKLVKGEILSSKPFSTTSLQA